ncbi:DUF551 domain-containing protein [Herbaspirillum robiniae]|uniref:DUF551 domain-containing protein n=1 Tax=Herbaspirillum robiniae TaxID=2014887 RepID=UPI0009A24EF1|nr:DUF551 domain-containing protein [Herbaspirillum robiniae]
MSIDKEKREEIGILLGYLDGATGTSLCREAAATIRYLMENITSTAMNNPIGWPTAQCICDIPEVHEALEAYSEDSTDDNAVALVCAALNAASAAIRNAAVDEQLVIEAFLKRSGQYVTNDASREAAIAEAVNAALEKAAQMVEDYQAEAVPVHFSTVASDIRALQSSPAPKQDGWQPIETAPKGKACLIFYRNTFGLARTIKAKFVAKHTVEADEEWPEDACDLDPLTETAYLPEDWYEMMDNHGDYAYVRLESAHNPTHWQPLPPAPQSPESKEGA